VGIRQIAADGYHGGMIDETAIRDRFEAMRVASGRTGAAIDLAKPQVEALILRRRLGIETTNAAHQTVGALSPA
jgi:hypothetical protein